MLLSIIYILIQILNYDFYNLGIISFALKFTSALEIVLEFLSRSVIAVYIN